MRTQLNSAPAGGAVAPLTHVEGGILRSDWMEVDQSGSDRRFSYVGNASVVRVLECTGNFIFCYLSLFLSTTIALMGR